MAAAAVQWRQLPLAPTPAAAGPNKPGRGPAADHCCYWLLAAAQWYKETYASGSLYRRGAVTLLLFVRFNAGRSLKVALLLAVAVAGR